MAFEKGHKFGKGNSNSGTKTKAQFVEEAAKKVKKLTIEELATDKVYKQLGTLKGRNKTDRQGVKEIALPVYLKSKADKSELSGDLNIVVADEVKKAIKDYANKETE